MKEGRATTVHARVRPSLVVRDSTGPVPAV
jgi:hypothetical protein